MQVKGKHVVITGAASGIGLGLARRFHQEGAASLILADVDAPGLAAAARELGATGRVCDVSREAEVEALVRTSLDTHGRIDLFCANAGIIARGGAETPDSVWQRMWGVNVMAHVYTARHVLPDMLRRGEGYLLFTVSAAGLLSQVNSASYSVTKHAALALAEWLLITHGAQGIKVSALCPQAVESKMTAGSNGGVAGQDGMLTAAQVAQSVVDGLADERFLILPHPEVATYFQRKAGDYSRWIRGMQRLQQKYGV
jgi:NAD(P)-dependent dehydrogenase (short-subunit alcohol dehydrogenase family)